MYDVHTIECLLHLPALCVWYESTLQFSQKQLEQSGNCWHVHILQIHPLTAVQGLTQRPAERRRATQPEHALLL